MEVPKLDNKDDAELKITDYKAETIDLSPLFSEADIKKIVEAGKLTHVTTGGKAGVFIGKLLKGDDDVKDVKVTSRGETKKIFWLIQGVYLCSYARYGSSDKYQLPANKNVERVWIDGKEIPLAVTELKASNLASKLIPKGIGLGSVNFDFPIDSGVISNILDSASEKLLGMLEMQDKTILKSGKLILPNVIEQVWDIKPFVFIHDDNSGDEITGDFKKKLIETLNKQNKGKGISKTKMEANKLIDIIKDKICVEPNDRPRKILERSLKIDKIIAFSVPFYEFKIGGKGKVENRYVNSITKDISKTI